MSLIIRLSRSLSFISFDVLALEGMERFAAENCFSVSSNSFILWLKASYLWEKASEAEESFCYKPFMLFWWSSSSDLLLSLAWLSLIVSYWISIYNRKFSLAFCCSKQAIWDFANSSSLFVVLKETINLSFSCFFSSTIFLSYSSYSIISLMRNSIFFRLFFRSPYSASNSLIKYSLFSSSFV